MIIEKKLLGIMIVVALLTASVAAGQPTVILTFDDGWISVCCDNTTQIVSAYSIIQPNNQAGVAFVNIAPIIGTGYTDYMKQAQINTLYSAGWDISSHTYNHAVLTNTTQVPNNTVMSYELNESKQWLDTNGYPRGAMFLAYPEGAYNDAIIASVQSSHYIAARTVEIPNATSPLSYTLGNAESFKMKTYETIGGIDNDTTVIQQIESVNATNGIMILVFHKIVTGTPTVDTEFKASDLQNISNYLKNSNARVVTFSQYFLTTISAPSAPTNASITVGPDWANYAWTSGSVPTNLYYIYVNGIRVSETPNTFINLSRVSGISDNVTVYGVNVNFTTGVHSVSPTALQMPPIPIWIPPSPTNIIYNYTMGTKNGTILIEWENGTVNATNNITDAFNVKIGNSWVINGSKNLSYTITNAIPGTIYPVQVFAVNNTNDITINPISVNISALIPVFKPPVPIQLGQSTGIFWGLFEWEANTSGNITNYYNYSYQINNDPVIWNTTNNSFVNITTIPYAKVNVSVFSVNSTNGGIQSESFLLMNLTMPNNPIEIFDGIWADYEIFAGDQLKFQPIYRNYDNDTLNFTMNTPNATGNVSINATTGYFIYNSTLSDVGKIYHWNITSDDGSGSSETIHFNVTINSRPVPSTYGGTSGGSGGGVNVYNPNAKSYERHDSQIGRNITSKVTFAKNKLISNVTFYGIRNYGEVTVKVSILKDNPTGSYLSNVHKFFSINLDSIPQENEYLYVSNATVDVLIDKSNLSNNIIKAYRYVNDSWATVEIEDTKVENMDKKQFKLKSDGLSNFVIVLEPIEPEPITMLTVTDGGKTAVNAAIDNTVEYVSKARDSLYRQIINLIKKYMWWI